MYIISRRTNPGIRTCLPVLATLVLALFSTLMISSMLVAQEENSVAVEAEALPLRLEAMVPSDTAVMMRFSGMETFLERGKALNLFRMWNDPEIIDFFADGVAWIPENFEQEGGSAYPFRQLRALCPGAISLAWCGGLPFLDRESPQLLILALDMGDDKAAYINNVDELVSLVAWAKGMTRKQESYGDHTLEVIEKPESGITLCYTTLDNLFLASLNLKFLKGVIDRHREGMPALDSDPLFTRSVAKVGTEATDTLLFIRVMQFCDILQPLLSLDMKGWLQDLGLDGARSVCAASSIANGGSIDSLYLDIPGEMTGLMKSLSPRPITAADLGKVPPDTLLLIDMVVDWGGLMEQISHILQNRFPPYYEGYRMGLDVAKDMSGLDLEQEFFGALRGELTYFVTMPRSGGMMMIPDIFLILSFQDGESGKVLMEKLIPFLQQQLQVTESSYDEQILRSITLPQSPLSPTLTLVGDRLLLAGSPLTMKKYLRWLKKEEPGLDQSEEFMAVMGNHVEGASMIHYFDLRRSVEMGYSAGIGFLSGALAGDDLPFDPSKLPMTETITDYISNGGAYMVTDEEGIIFSSHCPLGFGALLYALLAGADYLIEIDVLGGMLAEAPQPGRQVLGAPQQREPDLGAALRAKQGGAYAEAEQGFTNWINRNPNRALYTTWAMRHRADCRMHLARFEEALQDFQVVFEQDSSNSDLTYYAMARVYLAMNDLDQAFTYLEKAIVAGYSLDEGDPNLEGLMEDERYEVIRDIVSDVGTLMSDRDYEIGQQVITEWLFNHPYHGLQAWALKKRGDCFLKSDNVTEAIGDYEKACREEKAYQPQLYYKIACIHALAEEKDPAIEYLKRAIDSGFDDFSMIQDDGDLDILRDDPRFKALIWIR